MIFVAQKLIAPPYNSFNFYSSFNYLLHDFPPSLYIGLLFAFFILIHIDIFSFFEIFKPFFFFFFASRVFFLFLFHLYCFLCPFSPAMCWALSLLACCYNTLSTKTLASMARVSTWVLKGCKHLLLICLNRGYSSVWFWLSLVTI